MGVKGSERDLREGGAVWAGAEALWSTLALPLVACASLDDPQWADAVALPLSAADLRDAAGYPADDRRKRFLQRRAVLRCLVGQALGRAAAQVVIAHDAQGAPSVVAPLDLARTSRLHVSVAGRGSLAAFGLSWAPIGVDLEPVGAAVEPAWNLLHASERAWLEGLAAGERHRPFLQIWTVKEAYLKMHGLGLRIELSTVAVRISPDGTARISGNGQSQLTLKAQWRQLELNGKALLVADACV